MRAASCVLKKLSSEQIISHCMVSVKPDHSENASGAPASSDTYQNGYRQSFIAETTYQ